MNDIAISDAEWEVMRVVWAQDSTTSSEIIDVLSKKMSWKAPTIKTLIGRLVKKNMLKTQKDGKRFLYEATIEEQEAINHTMEMLLSQICSRRAGVTVGQMIEMSELSVGDIEMLEKTLAKKKQTAPLEIKCNCVPGQCTCHKYKNKGKEAVEK